MDINDLCASPSRIFPSRDFGRSWGNANVHSLFDIIVAPFVSPTVIGGLLENFVHGGCLV